MYNIKFKFSWVELINVIFNLLNKFKKIIITGNTISRFSPPKNSYNN